MASTALRLPCCKASMMVLISLVDTAVRCARLRTSSATTAKPRPCSPARAASIAALSASKLVCSAMLLITSSTVPICCACPASTCTVWLVPSRREASWVISCRARFTLSCPRVICTLAWPAWATACSTCTTMCSIASPMRCIDPVICAISVN
ncbi:hypothetical protein D3C78_1340250 [compost metagenome]